MKSRILRFISLPLVTVIIVLLFLRLNANYAERHEQVNKGYIAETSVNLSKDTDVAILTKVLLDNNYMNDEADARFAAEHIVGVLQSGEELSSLTNLDKQVWQIPAERIDSFGSPLYRERLLLSRYKLECDSLYNAKVGQPLESSVKLSEAHQGRIVVKVKCKNPQANWLQRKLGFDMTTCTHDSVVVRLARIYMDSIQDIHSENIAFARLNDKGVAEFVGVDTDELYSVLPIRDGYEYGTSKGTIGGTLASQGKEELECVFTEKEHRVRVFDATTLKQIKRDRTITVRTPDDFRSLLVQDVVILLLLWWLLSIYFNMKQRYNYAPLITILMFITGLSLLMMFSINDPLTDRLYGAEMAGGIYLGIAVIALFLHIDFTRFYRDDYRFKFDFPLLCVKWFFKPYKQKVSRMASTLVSQASAMKKTFSLIGIVLCFPLIVLDIFPFIYKHIENTKFVQGVRAIFTHLDAKGVGYILLALLLTILLFSPLGSEVGGMKVNLNIIGVKFQPSEIAKYLIIIFMAAFFCVNSTKIMQYSSEGNVSLLGSKVKMMFPILIFLSMLLIIYFFLGDMGPAMVLAFTFIIVYSMIKSKVSLDDATDDDRLKRILTCDIAMLVYGVTSFIALLVVGHWLGNMIIFALLWLLLWLVLGWQRRQLLETPIFFNFIVAMFLFGGSLLGSLPIDKMHSVANRLDSRMEMCTNTWGTLPLDGNAANAGENTQVVEGLWGLASGGFLGQGLGNGSPHFIPAYHTDMIMESIGEQMGFVGIAVVLLLIAMLLRKTIVVGYQSSHPFAFYLCLGIAVVTAVQFIIISLGSTGVIPLTGVTVPFFSYGKVSMILNLAAYGIVLSIALHNNMQANVGRDSDIEKVHDAEMSKYEFPVSILSMLFVVIVLFIGGVFFNYQCLQQDKTLIRPVYVNNVNGAPTVVYNPRIEQLTSKMRMGDIYDRNGVLLATSDRSKMNAYKDVYENCELDYTQAQIQRRYYPFGNHLFYMLGDYNTGLLFSTSRGYMAEVRHLSDLRGYDNVLREEGRAVKIKLKSDEYRPSRYHASTHQYVMPDSLQLRDYSALIPYLKAGVNSDKVSRINTGDKNFLSSLFGFEPIEPQDVKLTIDARLQTKLQQRLAEHAQQKYSSNNYNKVRMSIVVLDAKKGDLLSSANYPLPDYDRLRVDGDDVYSDNGKTSDWRAYSDMDLGLMYPSAPGSTAKVMTSMAGLRNGGCAMANQRYNVNYAERIFDGEKAMVHNMRDALRYSSNVYFIKLANDKNLYADMATVYAQVGVSIDGEPSYIMNYTEPTARWMSKVNDKSSAAVAEYRNYINSRKIRKMNYGEIGATQWSWSWGQGTMTATPLAMARVASIAANGGSMPQTRYVIDDSISTQQVEVLGTDEVATLKGYMQYTATNHDKFTDRNVGGKTGTPERVWKDANGEEHKLNDGWFICYIDNTCNNHTSGDNSRDDAIAVAVRIERLGNGYSGRAVTIVKDIVIPTLQELNYY